MKFVNSRAVLKLKRWSVISVWITWCVSKSIMFRDGILIVRVCVRWGETFQKPFKLKQFIKSDTTCIISSKKQRKGLRSGVFLQLLKIFLRKKSIKLCFWIVVCFLSEEWVCHWGCRLNDEWYFKNTSKESAVLK